MTRVRPTSMWESKAHSVKGIKGVLWGCISNVYYKIGIMARANVPNYNTMQTYIIHFRKYTVMGMKYVYSHYRVFRGGVLELRCIMINFHVMQDRILLTHFLSSSSFYHNLILFFTRRFFMSYFIIFILWCVNFPKKFHNILKWSNFMTSAE